MPMPMLGQALLVFLALVLLIATPISDFNHKHVFNPSWPAHARFHGAAYSLMNMGCAALCLGLILFGNPRPLALSLSGGMLAWSGIVLLVSAVIPGASAVADREPVWRGLAVSIWGTLVYLLLTALGTYLSLTGM